MFFFAIWMNWKHRNKVVFQNRPMAGSEGIIRNEVGGWIGGYSRNIGISTSFLAELWAIKDGFINVQKFSINN